MKTESIKTTAIVLEVLPSLQFKVKKLEKGTEIRVYLCGKMNKNRIKILAGDKVIVEIPSYIKLNNCVGEIIFRK